MGNQPDKENRQLQRAVNELTVLNDIATAINSVQPIKKIIDQIVSKCIKHLGVEEGTISLLQKSADGQEFNTMIRRQDSSNAHLPFKLDHRLTGWMIKNQRILLINNIREDEQFYFFDEKFEFQSILCVPLMIKGDLIGYLAVFNKKDGEPFTDEDRRLLSIIGSQSAQVIENARLYEEEKALIALQEEFRLAREVQLKLLPDHPPEIQGFQISVINIPAKSVGGDYYDFIPLDSSRIGFCVGDITGKGIPAAMLMANLQASFRSQAMLAGDCSTCLRGTNKLLFKNTESTKFATLFYGILDPLNSSLVYANGGHDAPFLFTGKQAPRTLDATGLLLGVMEESDYSTHSISFQPGDLLILYTDGVTEAMDKEGVEFGRENLSGWEIKTGKNQRRKLCI